MISFSAKANFNKTVTILFLNEDQVAKSHLENVPKTLKDPIKALYKSGQFTADNGAFFPLVSGNSVVLLAGVGKSDKMSGTALRITVRKAILSSYASKVKEIEIIPPNHNEATIKAVLEGILIGGYAWKKYFTKDKTDKTVNISDQKITVVVKALKNYEDTVTMCEGVTLTRNLINDNADIVTSEFIEKTIKDLIKNHKNISLEILNRKEMETKGLGLHLAVNQGSPKEPKLIIVKYAGGNPKDRYMALVGKGITFDTGGLNLKPTGSIETMRADMSGTAAVVGTLKNILSLNIKRNLLFVCGVAENAIGSKSYKPGDVFRSYSGKTVEIGNTDAEGRLVLADAIAYVVKNYKPEHLIDLATLTGACVIALGHDYSGLFSNDDALANDLIRSSQETDDRVWRLPNYPEIKNYIKSNVADIKNVGLSRGAAGACTAAEFLRQFVGETKWAHLDIAGTAFVDSSTGRMYFGYGATGAGVRLLTHYLIHG